MTEWRTLREFPNYEIGVEGVVVNSSTDRVVAKSKNQFGIYNVALHRNGSQCRRSLARLVAENFLPPPMRADFDSVIHLDGDKSNCAAANLMWRPRSYAILYHKQFDNERRTYNNGIIVPVIVEETGEIFNNSWAAAKRFGLINAAIRRNDVNGGVNWPSPYHITALPR